MVAVVLAEAPAAADETPSPVLMKVKVKVTFAWSNHPSMQHLAHYRDVEVMDDGSDTLAQVKQRFADAEGVPVEMVQFMWFDQTIGRRHMNRPCEEMEARTLADYNIAYWLKRFPSWHLTATIVEDEPMEPLETVHRTVALIHKGFEEGPKLDRHINVKKKKPSWNRLVYSAPPPHEPGQGP